MENNDWFLWFIAGYIADCWEHHSIFSDSVKLW